MTEREEFLTKRLAERGTELENLKSAMRDALEHSTIERRATMALFDVRHRLELPGGYWLQKQNDNRWQIGCGEMFLACGIDGNVPVGVGGSMDCEIKQFADAMNGAHGEKDTSR